MDLFWIGFCIVALLTLLHIFCVDIPLRELRKQIERMRGNLLCLQQTVENVAESLQKDDVVRYERKDPVDEGFENIMRFNVNGRTGFEFSDKE